jgi:deazaflavin-dependent oxidoreductase (nitroreductase family)
MPSDWQFQLMNGIHRGMLKLSGGRVGGRLGSMLVLELTTIGRKSGRPRTVMLTSPLQEGDALVVVASRGGDDHHPAWFQNLREHPEVTVTIVGKPKQAMRARMANSDERARLWPAITANAANYAGYQRRTDREIPVVLLEPIGVPST